MSVCPVLINAPDLNNMSVFSLSTVSVTELTACPVSINESSCELSTQPVFAEDSNVELSVCSVLVFCSAVGIFGLVCSTVVVLSATCSADPVLASCFALAPCSTGSTPVPCSALVLYSAGSASFPNLSTSTWTWPSVPPPVSAPPSWIVLSWEHLEAALFGGGGGGGALSQIRSVAFRPSIILTLTPHRLLHVTLDYISHVPLHWLDLPAVNHTHTILHPFRSFSNCQVLSAFISLLMVATLWRHSVFLELKFSLVHVCLPVFWS